MQSLYAWLRAHPRLVDGCFAAMLGMMGLVEAVTTRDHPPLTGPGRVLYVVIAIPLVWRRSHPARVFWTITALGFLQVVADTHPGPSDLAILFAIYALAAYTPRPHALYGLAVSFGAPALALVRWMPGTPRPPDVSTVLYFTFIYGVLAAPLIIVWVIGDNMRTRRAYLTELEDRAARLERERDAQAQIAAAAERARIARELHDVVAHSVSAMVVQADGAGYAMDTAPEQAREALARIGDTGRQALAEMRQLLGVLRSASGSEEYAPQPGVDQLTDLLDHVRATGLPVEFTVEGVPHRLPSSVALAAYRIVQEALTNTRKHAGLTAEALVRLRYGDDVLTMEIADNGLGTTASTDGQGHGLIGMRERVALFGGTLRAGPRPRGGFEVVATLPLTTREDRHTPSAPAWRTETTAAPRAADRPTAEGVASAEGGGGPADAPAVAG